ncbi:unnamed protein product [Sphagnum jensenii]|uniref:Glutaredoxin domain-containing protein n=1 Tax=Sphagnum jensenii TaxID=128206 RepID=A0ABP1AV08_9BRYO
MGCSTSKSAATLLGSSSEVQRVKKKLGKSHSFAPLRSSQLMSDHNMMPMHYDYHVVALTSSTYGIMKLVEAEKYAESVKTPLKNEISSCSDNWEQEELETINTWELMAGLDDLTPRPSPLPDSSSQTLFSKFSSAAGAEEDEVLGYNNNSTSLLLFDPDILASFAASSADGRTETASESDEWCRDAMASTSASLADEDVTSHRLEAFERKCPPGGDERVVLYSTSLRGIRKTYEDCNSLRMIFQSYHVWIDERDVSMHANFLQELKMLLLTSSRAGGAAVGSVQVPRVFIMGHYIGGLEQVLPLHEEGLLGELLINLAPQPHPTACCDGCGGIRFVPCPDCSGSCKKISTQHNQITRCPDCNENGLIRCPICF